MALNPIAYTEHCLQLRDERAPAGVSAVIVYPMNALAEDQLMRLRGLLAGTGRAYSWTRPPGSLSGGLGECQSWPGRSKSPEAAAGPQLPAG